MDGEAGNPNLATVAREWGRIGCIGFGGPPAHVALLRETCVERRGWLSGAVALFLVRRDVLAVLAVGGLAGVAAALAGAPLPG